MKLVETRYQADHTAPNRYICRVSQDTLDFRVPGEGTNTAVTTAVTVPLRVYMDAGRSGLGVHARGVHVAYVSGQGAQQTRGPSFFIPVLRSGLHRRIRVGSAGVYRGLDVIIVGKVSETIRN